MFQIFILIRRSEGVGQRHSIILILYPVCTEPRFQQHFLQGHFLCPNHMWNETQVVQHKDTLRYWLKALWQLWNKRCLRFLFNAWSSKKNSNIKYFKCHITTNKSERVDQCLFLFLYHKVCFELSPGCILYISVCVAYFSRNVQKVKFF